MGVEFKLTDRELPASPAFITFLAQWIRGQPFEREPWPDQLSESLFRGEDELNRRAAEAGDLVMGNAAGRELVARAYTLLLSLLTGVLDPLEEMLARFQFVNVIGIPRTGGSYLTAELYRSIGLAPEGVPSVIAHDSFPDAAPFALQPGTNGWILSLKTMAEYLTMVELYFSGREPVDGRIVVPKKLTKIIYAGGFFARVLGPGAEYLLTVRHPAAACVSTYDKSGGLPRDGRFTVRSNIEEWCRRDLQCIGLSVGQLQTMDYFEVYLRYWEHYHLCLVTSGLSASRNLRVIAFGKQALQSIAQRHHDRYCSGLQASGFQEFDDVRQRHPDWIERAQPSIERIAAAWKLAGLAFPVDEIGACR